MANFFVNRPIVAIVISIITVIIGIVAILGLPIAQYPDIVPPEIFINTTYVGADAQTVEQSVATPIEQEMSGVDNMNYMYSLNANNGELKLYVNFDVKTDPNIDQVLTQIRKSQADSKLPAEVRDYGVTVKKSTSSPLMLVALSSPGGSYDATFLANYAYINLNDQLTRVPGDRQRHRLRRRPVCHAPVGEAGPARQAEHHGAGDRGCHQTTEHSQPGRPGRRRARAARQRLHLRHPRSGPAGGPGRVRADRGAGQPGRLAGAAEGRRAHRAGLPDLLRLAGRLNGKPSAVLALYQLPGSNAIAAVDGVTRLMEEVKKNFPSDLEYSIPLDTTQSVREGIKEILTTLYEALILVVIVVFIFLQGWRATLIPALAVPVSLVGTFAMFPLLGFSINTIALMGLVLAIGLVVDDAIVVVEAVEHHIEHGLSPKEATVKAMEEVSGPVVAIALVLSAVFLPTVFIPGITGKLYQQFAVTIAISVIISAFNALTLEPGPVLPDPEAQEKDPRPPGRLLPRVQHHVRQGHQRLCEALRVVHPQVRDQPAPARHHDRCDRRDRQAGPRGLPAGGGPGLSLRRVQLPNAASLQRTDVATRELEKIIMETPGVQYCTTVVGYSLLSGVTNTYSGFFFITLKPWHERKSPDEKYAAIMASLNRRMGGIPQGVAFAFSPPAIPGIGTSGGVTFILEDRAGKDIDFLWANTQKFMAEAKKRPEIARVTTTFLPTVPQIFVDVDRDKVLKQGVDLNQVYRTLQAFMGGYFINYFNRFGRTWQVYIQAEGEYRTRAEQLGQFYVRNAAGDTVPLSALTSLEQRSGPEFTMRYNLYRSAQLNVVPAPGFSSAQAMGALEAGVRRQHAARDGLRLSRHELPGEKGPGGGAGVGDLRAFAALRLPDPGRPVRELVAALQRAPGHAHRDSWAPSPGFSCATWSSTSTPRSG